MEKTEANIADIDDLIFENEEIRQSERWESQRINSIKREKELTILYFVIEYEWYAKTMRKPSEYEAS